MNDKIVTVTFPTCGTCRYAQKPDMRGFCDCHGWPPQIIVTGAGQDALGRTGIQMDSFVPKVKTDRPGCSLHQPKQDFSTLGRS